MAHETPREDFQKELLRFRASLSGEHRELLDQLISAALTERPAPIFRGETLWTSHLAEDVLLDIGLLKIVMPGATRTCGGRCKGFVTDPVGDIYCVATCSGDVHPKCSCHLYSYPTPAPGEERPRMQEWQHDWAPGMPHHTPVPGRTYECVCVK